MDECRQLGFQKAAEGFTVVALEQTSGRGRVQRQWFTPRGSLAVSILLYPGMQKASEVVMLGALSVIETCQSLGIPGCGIKWPNDVLIQGKKVAGVLVETHGGTPSFTVLGIGLNVNIIPEIVTGMQIPRTSLAGEAGCPLDLTGCLITLLKSADMLYRMSTSGTPLFEIWRRNLITLGEKVNIRGAAGSWQGVATDVNPDGSLLVRTADDKIITVTAGDVNLA